MVWHIYYWPHSEYDQVCSFDYLGNQQLRWLWRRQLLHIRRIERTDKAQFLWLKKLKILKEKYLEKAIYWLYLYDKIRHYNHIHKCIPLRCLY